MYLKKKKKKKKISLQVNKFIFFILKFLRAEIKRPVVVFKYEGHLKRSTLRLDSLLNNTLYQYLKT